jgi:hypothetical protein
LGCLGGCDELVVVDARSGKYPVAVRALEVSVSNAKVLQYRALRMAARVAEELDR